MSGNVYGQQVVLLSGIYVIAASGLNVLRAISGQMSFGHGAVLGVAAYVTALGITVWELPSPVPELLGLLAGLAVGTLVSLPSLRVQGYYLGFVTMGAALALPSLLFLFKDQTLAVTGVNVFGTWWSSELTANVSWLTLIIPVVTILALGGYAHLESSELGRQMRLAAESPEAAMTLGLSPGRLRLLAFFVANLCASIAGILYTQLIQYVAPGSFTLALSIMLYFIVVIGGQGTIAGVLAGVLLLFIGPEIGLASLLDYKMLIYGLITFIVMFFIPDGVVGGLRRLIAKLRGQQGRLQQAGLTLDPFLAALADEHKFALRHGRDHVALQASGLRRSFGAVKALDGVDLTVRSGDLHAIGGPNGGGTTALPNAVSGLMRIDEGAVRLGSHDISGLNAVARARAGFARTFQTPRLVGNLTVWENLAVNHRISDSTAWLDEALASHEEEWSITRADAIPHGQRRIVEIMRALRSSPIVLALDEPASGLSQRERTEFGKFLRQLVEASGTTGIMVEHDLELVWDVADQITVMEAGRVLANGSPADLRSNTSIAHLFPGERHVAG
jgi:branched-chain amino acid transport system permease protein